MNSEISTNNDDIDPLLSLDQQQQQIRNPNPKRRKHNRVRTGCFTCRKRKRNVMNINQIAKTVFEIN